MSLARCLRSDMEQYHGPTKSIYDADDINMFVLFFGTGDEPLISRTVTRISRSPKILIINLLCDTALYNFRDMSYDKVDGYILKRDCTSIV